MRYLGHEFTTLNSVITIPTACEVCSSFTWLKEKGLVCQSCKLTCHKKCYTRIVSECAASGSSQANNNNSSLISRLPVASSATVGRLFGVPLEKLFTGSQRLPPIIERLITTIEVSILYLFFLFFFKFNLAMSSFPFLLLPRKLVGLYTEGLYRKSGVTSRVQQLKRQLEEEMCQQQQQQQQQQENRGAVVDLKEQPVHVLTAVLKSFLREMPQPLLTFERYEEFLRAADIADDQERTSSLMALIQELPVHHFDLLERIVFHLTRVALNEKSNRMGPNALAIVFAPCILRTRKLEQAQDSLLNVSKQTTVVESILNEQLRRVSDTLADIDSLDSVCLAYAARLCTLRSSKMYSAGSLTSNAASAVVLERQEEQLIQKQLHELRQEKAALAATLPSLARSASDDDLLSTDGDLDIEEDSPVGGSMDDLSSNLHSCITGTISN